MGNFEYKMAAVIHVNHNHTTGPYKIPEDVALMIEFTCISFLVVCLLQLWNGRKDY